MDPLVLISSMDHRGIWTPPHGLKVKKPPLRALRHFMSTAHCEQQTMKLFAALELFESSGRTLLTVVRTRMEKIQTHQVYQTMGRLPPRPTNSVGRITARFAVPTVCLFLTPCFPHFTITHIPPRVDLPPAHPKDSFHLIHTLYDHHFLSPP